MPVPHTEASWAACLELRAATAAAASLCFTAKHTECSELAWLIMITFTLASRTVVKIALAVPCAAWHILDRASGQALRS